MKPILSLYPFLNVLLKKYVPIKTPLNTRMAAQVLTLGNLGLKH